MLAAAIARGQQLTVSWADFTSAPATNRPMWLVATNSTPTVFGTNLIGSDLVRTNTGSNAVVVFPQVNPGTYNLVLFGREQVSQVTITITNGTATNAALNAKDLTSVATNSAAGSSAYSQAAADGRFVHYNAASQGVTNIGAGTGTFQWAGDTNFGGKIFALVWDTSGFTLGNGVTGNFRVSGAGVSGLAGVLSANQFFGAFVGDGSGLTNLAATTNASLLTTGTLPAARLPATGVTAGTATKVTYGADGRITGTNALAVADLPSSMVTSNYSSAVSLSNIQNSIVASNVLLSAGGVSSRGSFLWNGGALSSPDDPGFLWFDNTNHGTTQGNASELQWSFNQMYFGPANGLHAQFGLNSDSLGDALVMQWIGNSLTNYNRSHLLGFHNKIVAGDAFMHFWSDTYWDTNHTQLHFTGMVDGGNQDWVQRGSDKMVIDREGQVQITGAVATGFTNASATGTNYGIDWTGPEVQEVDLSADLNLYETNFNAGGNFTNKVARHRQIIIYPGQGNWNLATPAGWPAPTVPYGVATNVQPLVITNSMIAFVDICKTIGASATNTYIQWSYQPYTAQYDSSASNFFTLASFTTTEKIAINQLILDMKAASIFTGAFDFVHPQCGSTSNSTKWSVVATNKFPITWNIPASIVFGAQGVYGNGGSTWGDTGFNPSSAPSPNFVQNSAMLGFYSKFNPGYTNGDGSTGNGQSTIGANFVAATKGATEFTTAGTSNAATTIQWNGFNNNQQTAFTYGAGFQFANRTGATTCTYVSGANSATDANTTTGVNTQNFYLLANDDAGAFRFSTNAVAIDWCGRGLNGTELNAWSNAVLRFVTTLGRQ